MKPIVVSGYKDSGKTAVVEGLVEVLSGRGYRVGTVKHISQNDFTLDQKGSDTWRHKKAGSEIVVALSPNETGILKGGEGDLDEIMRTLLDLDFVILEGFKNSKDMIRVVVANSSEEAKKLRDEFTVCFVGFDDLGERGYGHEDIGEVADLLEERAVSYVGGLDCGDCGYESCRNFVLSSIEGDNLEGECKALSNPVQLFVDGKRIPMNSFVRNIVSNTIRGLVSSLNNSEGRKIEIRVEDYEG
ncbi:MAG: molybdopterin-guanine dinucleotide biosynthesis protein B [Candidatus Hadarchaeia archaeon]